MSVLFNKISEILCSLPFEMKIDTHTVADDLLRLCMARPKFVKSAKLVSYRADPNPLTGINGRPGLAHFLSINQASSIVLALLIWLGFSGRCLHRSGLSSYRVRVLGPLIPIPIYVCFNMRIQILDC